MRKNLVKAVLLVLAVLWCPLLIAAALTEPPRAHRAFVDATVTTTEENVVLSITPTGSAYAIPTKSIVISAPAGNTQDIYYSINAASVSAPTASLGESGVLSAGESRPLDILAGNIRYESASGTQAIRVHAVY